MGEPALAQVFLTRDEALREYFPPPAVIQRRTVYLTDAQVHGIEEQARAKVDSRLVTYYVATSGGKTLGYAFFVTHTVRTMPETFVAIVDPDSTVRGVEILAFHEPEDYRPTRRWLDQFNRIGPQSDLRLKRGIANIAGATITAEGITSRVRVILATFTTTIPKE
jgi:hypothetical protein